MRVCKHDKRYVNAHVYDRRAYVYIYIRMRTYVYIWTSVQCFAFVCGPIDIADHGERCFQSYVAFEWGSWSPFDFFVNESGRFSRRVYKCECVSLSYVCEIQHLTTCEYVNISIYILYICKCIYIYMYICKDRGAYIYIHVNIGQCMRTKNTYVCRLYLYNIVHIWKHVDNNVNKKITGSMYMYLGTLLCICMCI